MTHINLIEKLKKLQPLLTEKKIDEFWHTWTWIEIGEEWYL